MSSSPSVEAEAETPTVFEEQEPPGEELLSPLSPGDWQSPAEPAPAAQLPEVSLAERIRRFELSVPEVVQSSPQQPPAPQPLWQPPMAPAPETALAPEPIARPGNRRVARFRRGRAARANDPRATEGDSPSLARVRFDGAGLAGLAR